MAKQREYEVYPIPLPKGSHRLPMPSESFPATEVETLMIEDLLGKEKAEAYSKLNSKGTLNGYSTSRANRLIYDQLLKRLVSEAQRSIQTLVNFLPEKFINSDTSLWLLQKADEAFISLDMLRALVDGSPVLPVHLRFLQQAHGLSSASARPPGNPPTEEPSTGDGSEDETQDDESWVMDEELGSEDLFKWPMEIEPSGLWSEMALRYLKSIVLQVKSLDILFPTKNRNSFRDKLLSTLEIRVINAQIHCSAPAALLSHSNAFSQNNTARISKDLVDMIQTPCLLSCS